MNPLPPLQPVQVARLPRDAGDGRSRNRQSAEDFRRQLEEKGGDGRGDPSSQEPSPRDPDPAPVQPPATRASARPVARGLQPRGLYGRQQDSAPLRHIDVIA